MYARGMSTRGIEAHLKEIYGVDVSPTLISTVTDAVQEEVRAWQNRPLEALYPILYMDALYVKMRHNGHVENRAVYVAIDINMEWSKEVLPESGVKTLRASGLEGLEPVDFVEDFGDQIG